MFRHFFIDLRSSYSTGAPITMILTQISLLLSPPTPWHPSISDHSRYSPSNLILVFPFFFFHLVFSIHALFTVLSSGVFTIWPASSSRLPFMVLTIFDFAHKTRNSSSVPIPQPFWCVIVPYIFLSISRCHVLRDDFVCSFIAHASKPIFFEPIGSFSDLQNM